MNEFQSIDETIIDISIVIVNYNVKDFLYKCLQSISNSETNLNIQTIVIDNDSQDGSVQYLEGKFPNVEFIQNKENVGFSKANNIGFKISKGKYILILNPDTLISKDTLDVMYKYMETYQNIAISGCKVLNGDGSFQVTCRRGFPTPWASFCKLFGLQTLFPNSKVFAQYNQTYRSIDETYYIDAVIGAFMFCKKSVIDELRGFDETFFMYGEDLDLCFRAKKLDYEVAYHPKTTIIHYKGESTKRSNINDLYHFYNAMEIFVRKHYSSSAKLFLFLLKMGIQFRGLIAKAIKYKSDLIYIILDLIILFSTLLIATKFRFGHFLGFPDYAYPNVIIVIGLVHFSSMIGVGGYFESNHSVTKFSYGVLGSFFLLSVLMYFFQDYAFSRGVLLVMIGGTILIGSFLRLLIGFWNKLFGNDSDRRLLIVGQDYIADRFIAILQESQSSKLAIVGKVIIELTDISNDDYPVLGNISYLSKLIDENNVNEVIFSDRRLSHSDIIKLIQNSSNNKVRYHVANDDDELIASNIINEITGNNLITPKYKLNYIRYKILKRIFDIGVSFLGIILISLFSIFIKNIKQKLNKLVSVFVGKKSIVGIFPTSKMQSNYKYGLTGLVQISKNHKLTDFSIDKLNSFYLENYSISLDFEIIIKHLFRK